MLSHIIIDSYNMRLSDWLTSLIIIIIFCGLMVFAQVSGKLEDIKKNWHQYKCNPIMIPFASYVGEDPAKTFAGCVTSASSGFVQTALGPINQIFSSLTGVAQKQEESTNNSRKSAKRIRSKMSGLGGSIFGIIFSFSSEVSKIGLKIKDTMSKLAGVIATLVHVLTTSMETMNSIWAGPPGQTLRFVGGLCFEEGTRIRLKNNTVKTIAEIRNGDILMDGSVVFGTMKLLNHHEGEYLDDMYVIEGMGQDGDDIYVSGSHLVMVDNNEFVNVKDHPLSKKMSKNFNELNCLITNTHTIPIGKLVFGDWEDNGELPDLIKYFQKKIKRHV